MLPSEVGISIRQKGCAAEPKVQSDSLSLNDLTLSLWPSGFEAVQSAGTSLEWAEKEQAAFVKPDCSPGKSDCRLHPFE